MLDISKSCEDDYLIISISGEMDLSNHMALIHIISNTNMPKYSHVSLNLQNLQFIDSTAIKTLIDVLKGLLQKGKILRIINTPEDIKEIFDLLNIQEVIGREVFE